MNKPLKDNQFLGPLCKHGHEFEDTGKSLRRHNGYPSGVCLECQKMHREMYRLFDALNLPPDPKTYLGPPCKHGHIEANGKTRRYRCGQCVKCCKERVLRNFRKRKNNPNQEVNCGL